MVRPSVLAFALLPGGAHPALVVQREAPPAFIPRPGAMVCLAVEPTGAAFDRDEYRLVEIYLGRADLEVRPCPSRNARTWADDGRLASGESPWQHPTRSAGGGTTMLDDVEGLRALVAVADLGTFSAAGRALKRSTNAVSHRVARLERRLGTRLFERTTRVVRATAAGVRLVERAREVLAALELLEQEAATGHLEGTVRVALPPDLASADLFTALAQAMAAAPGLTVELCGRSAPADPRREGLDLVVWGGPTAVPPDLTARRLGEVAFWLCAAPSYVARFGAPRTPEALARHRCLLARAPGPERSWTLVGPEGETRTVPVKGPLESDSPGLLVGALDAGLGVGLRPSAEVATASARGEWVHLLPGWALAPLPVALVAPRGRLRAPAVRLVAGLLEAAVRRLAEPLPLSQPV